MRVCLSGLAHRLEEIAQRMDDEGWTTNTSAGTPINDSWWVRVAVQACQELEWYEARFGQRSDIEQSVEYPDTDA